MHGLSLCREAKLASDIVYHTPRCFLRPVLDKSTKKRRESEFCSNSVHHSTVLSLSPSTPCSHRASRDTQSCVSDTPDKHKTTDISLRLGIRSTHCEPKTLEEYPQACDYLACHSTAKILHKCGDCLLEGIMIRDNRLVNASSCASSDVSEMNSLAQRSFNYYFDA